MRTGLILLSLFCVPAFASDLEKGEVRRVTVSTAQAEVLGGSTAPSLSANGRFAAFSCAAPGLIPGDENGMSDIFLHDRKKGLLTRESVGLISLNQYLDSIDPNGASTSPSVSRNGRYVAFQTAATNIVRESSDQNGVTDIVVRDRVTGDTIRASVASDGTQANQPSARPSLSASGRYVVFDSPATNLVPADGNALADVFIHDTRRRVTERVSVDRAGGDPNGASWSADVSADGRFVVFSSNASDLVDSDLNNQQDVFLFDRATGKTLLVSRPKGGGHANGASNFPRISDNGRYVVFQSSASNLVGGDGNGAPDIFLFERRRRRLRRVSVPVNGGDATGLSVSPEISANGRFIVFASTADDLVPGDSNGQKDVFRLDRRRRTLVKVSTPLSGNGPNGTSASPCVSASGRFICYESVASDLVEADTNNLADIFLADMKRSRQVRVSVSKGLDQGDDHSGLSGVSRNGRLVLFSSRAANLVPGDVGGKQDAFVRDLDTGITERISLGMGSAEANDSSAPIGMTRDERFVLINSLASNLVPGDNNGSGDIFLFDRRNRTTELLSRSSQGVPGDANSWSASISANGRRVAFDSGATNLVAGDNNGVFDIFLRDVALGETTLVSIAHDGSASNGDSLNPRITRDGRRVFFESDATNLVPNDSNGQRDIFLRDLERNTTTLISVSSSGSAGNGDSDQAAISADGRFVAFRSAASNLTADDTNLVADVFVRDLRKGRTLLVSRNASGAVADDASGYPSISGNGRFLAFQSTAGNLAADDTNGQSDIFLLDRKRGRIRLVSRDRLGMDSDGYSVLPRLSENGKYLGFTSMATDLVPADTNFARDGFLYRR